MEHIGWVDGEGNGHWSLCDGRFILWDRGDTIAELSLAGGLLVGWVRAELLTDDPDWEKLYARGTAFPGHLSVEASLQLPTGAAQRVETIEQLEEILKASTVVEAKRGAAR